MGVLRILGPSGDVAAGWRPDVEEDVERVRQQFDDIIRQGYLVFELDEETKEGRQVRTFDPAARELRAFRPMVGG